MLKSVIIWVFGLAIAVLASLTAMGAISKNKAPTLAITLSPINGFAAEKLASASIMESVANNRGQFPDRITLTTTQLARKAFLAEPVTPDAIAVLALGKGGKVKQNLMNDALSLSRRQPLVIGWMIADSGAREDILGLLNHYDTMIRSSSSAASAVIPVMADALVNDNFVEPFTNLLSKQPPWTNLFWRVVVRKPEAITNASRLREALYKPGENNLVYRDPDLIRALINQRQFERAERLYNHVVDKKKVGTLIKNGSFDAKSEFAPIDWQLFSTGEYGAAITDGKIELSAIRNAGGLFARQLVNLPARTLILEVNPSATITGNANVFLTLTCAEKITRAPKAIRIPLKSKIENLQINNSQSGCSFYWLDINGSTSENSDGFDIAFDSISLR